MICHLFARGRITKLGNKLEKMPCINPCAGKSLLKQGAPPEPFYTLHFGYKQVAPMEL